MNTLVQSYSLFQLQNFSSSKTKEKENMPNKKFQDWLSISLKRISALNEKAGLKPTSSIISI